jgi:BirA family biotin operon repressor/biotin-[acetyl-CoA-carboxylase] ligase
VSRAAELLPLLSALGRTPVSGQTLARKLHLSRTAVWKQIHELKAAGLPITTLSRRGYVLEGMPDFSLAALRFAGAIESWARPHYELSAVSTQVLAKQAALGGIPEGHFWVSELQTGGRGRLERVWSSGFGGLWFSLVLRPQVPPARAASIGLVAALTLSRAIEKVSGIPARLKWPNDVLVATRPKGFKKVAGFLTEMSGEVDKTDWVVLGVGLNVFNELPEELRGIAAALGDFNTKKSGAWTRGDLLAEFLKEFYAAYRVWQRTGFLLFRDAYWHQYSKPNQPCVLKTAGGELRGIACSVDASGALVLEVRRQKKTVLEGEIVL